MGAVAVQCYFAHIGMSWLLSPSLWGLGYAMQEPVISHSCNFKGSGVSADLHGRVWQRARALRADQRMRV